VEWRRFVTYLWNDHRTSSFHARSHQQLSLPRVYAAELWWGDFIVLACYWTTLQMLMRLSSTAAAAGSMSIYVFAISSGPKQVPGNLFPAQEIYFPGINIVNI